MTQRITADCLADIPGLAHGFFTREGGVSAGIYSTLNCGLGSRDDPALVTQNRFRIAAALGQPGATVITPNQVHSAVAVIADAPWPRDALPKADAIVTAKPGLVIGVLTADCAPVIFADPVARIVAVAHAGWRGALSGILEATVAAMASIGARRSRIRAVLGPCINQAAYEVGPEFEAAFTSASLDNARYFKRLVAEGRPHFDLPGFVGNKLAALELDTVELHSGCTYANPDHFFSYRRSTHLKEPDYGRQISAIVVA